MKILKFKFLLKIFIIFIIFIILSLFSCDVLTKMNRQEWDEQNLDEEVKKEISVYITGTSRNNLAPNDDIFTIKTNIFNKVSKQHRFDTGAGEFGYAIYANNNNIYVGGNNNADFQIIKYDSNLIPIISVNYNFTANDTIFGITCDNSNNVYATGTDGNDFYTRKFDSDLNPITPFQIFDANGSADQAYGIAYSNGFVYVVGFSSLPPGEPAGDTDMTIIKYNSNNLTPSIIEYYPRNPIENFYHQAKDIAIDNYGNIYVFGWVVLPGPQYDCILLKYDSDLNLIWSKIIDINDDDRGEGVAVDSAGNIYLAIQSRPNAGDFDCYTIKYNQLGNEEWTRQYGTNGINDELWDISVDPLGNVYSVGSSNNDYLFIMYDYYGNELSVNKFDGGFGLNDYARAVAVNYN